MTLRYLFVLLGIISVATPMSELVLIPKDGQYWATLLSGEGQEHTVKIDTYATESQIYDYKDDDDNPLYPNIRGIISL